MADYRVELFSESHDVESFSCGEESLDVFLNKDAGNYSSGNLARTYVLCDHDEPIPNKVLGYFAISCTAIARQQLPTKGEQRWPKHSRPAVLLGRFAIDRSLQGKGLGVALFKRAARVAFEIRGRISSYFT